MMAVGVLAQWSCTLREPTTPVQVGGETFHLHRAVLQKSAFLAPTLDKDWTGDQPLNLELPCSTEDFVLLAVALYTGEEIGTPRLPVPDLARALRLARAADKLLVADSMPELKRVLQSAVRTSEDREVAAAAAPTLPPALREALEEVCKNTDDIDLYGLDVNEKVCSGIVGAKNDRGQQVIWSALATFWGHLKAQDVANAAKKIMLANGSSSNECGFAARIAAEKLDVHHAMLVFPNDFLPFSRSQDFEETYRAAYREHVLRCARERILAEIIVTRLANRRYMENLFSESALFTEALLASPPDQLEQVVQAMHRMDASDLGKILSAELLRAVPSHNEALMQPLLQSSTCLLSWATEERLAALPLRLKQASCVALLPEAGRLTSEVAEVVLQLLAAPWQHGHSPEAGE